MNLALRSIFVRTSKGSLACRNIFRHGADGLTSSSKEGMLRIFVALKSPSSLVGFEPAKFVSNLNDDNKQTS